MWDICHLKSQVKKMASVTRQEAELRLFGTGHGELQMMIMSRDSAIVVTTLPTRT